MEEVSKYNTECKNYCEQHTSLGTEYLCDADMDMTFCNDNCAYATNNPHHSKFQKLTDWEKKNRF